MKMVTQERSCYIAAAGRGVFLLLALSFNHLYDRIVPLILVLSRLCVNHF